MTAEAPRLAPAVMVVGPANSGKTTFLHHLDELLQHHPGRPLVYVLKGSPDGTGRYLLHAPALREGLKPLVKGRWTETTVATIAAWIDECRRHLDLVLVDCGGKRTPSNEQLFRHGTHSIVVARRFDDPSEEGAEGLAAWRGDCARAGLELVAELVATGKAWALGPSAPPLRPADSSRPRPSPPQSPSPGRLEWVGRKSVVSEAEEWGIEGVRGLECADREPVVSEAEGRGTEGVRGPTVVETVAQRLLALLPARRRPEYLDLRRARDWGPADLAGLRRHIARQADALRREGRVTLGGRAPVWAYAAALHAVLRRAPDVQVVVFDPKAPGGLVEIPPAGLEGWMHLPEASLLTWSGLLQARWQLPASGAGATLVLTLTGPDRLLPPEASRWLADLALPAPLDAPGPWVVSGAVPIWLHLTVSRRLAQLAGPRPLAVWDARSQCAVRVAGRARWTSLPWPADGVGPAPDPQQARKRGEVGRNQKNPGSAVS
ncbi:MAG TPA: CRISPR-associated protein Csx3 [Thermoanaerobaculia bacterium]|nr:CRISPR-associated protein Csx3 [Thermoanaerobaculia bacterium]